MAERQWRAGPINIRVRTPDQSGRPDRQRPRERLSRERIVDTALSQMAVDGYDAVSMRSLARALGTGPASLYAHVANKDELDQLVIDRIAQRIPLPEPDPARWREQSLQLMRDTLAAYRAHPGSARAALATIPTGEGGLTVAECTMALLLAGGIHPQAAAWFVDLGALYVCAIAAEESIWTERAKAAERSGAVLSEEETVAEVQRVFAALPPDLFPSLVAHAGVLTTGDGEERFEFGLEVLLAGLEAVSRRWDAGTGPVSGTGAISEA